MEENLEPNNKATNEISENPTKSNSEEIKEPKSEVLDIKGNNSISQNNSAPKVDIKTENDTPVKNIPKPKKDLPIEKKPFQEFVNVHLIPIVNPSTPARIRDCCWHAPRPKVALKQLRIRRCVSQVRNIRLHS